MKIRIPYLALCAILILGSCEKDPVIVGTPPQEDVLTTEQRETVDYFKEIALGFEFGNAAKITRKWRSPMRIFVDGEKDGPLLAELDRIISEINDLVSDGFQIEIVSSIGISNYYLFLGTGDEYSEKYPDSESLINSNWGLFNINWNGINNLTNGRMYVDIVRADSIIQKHLLREELTQSLGLARDSERYEESIFQQRFTSVTEYAPIDRRLIELLYDPAMTSGLDSREVESVLIEILMD